MGPDNACILEHRLERQVHSLRDNCQSGTPKFGTSCAKINTKLLHLDLEDFVNRRKIHRQALNLEPERIFCVSPYQPYKGSFLPTKVDPFRHCFSKACANAGSTSV